MKYLIILILLVGCGGVPLDKVERSFETIQYEGHDYLIGSLRPTPSHRGYGFMAHKGNCKCYQEKK